jgi:uncharacterized delta-60 repeat protein
MMRIYFETPSSQPKSEQPAPAIDGLVKPPRKHGLLRFLMSVLALVALGCAPASANGAAAGHLDRSFGRQGRVMLPLHSWRVAAATPDGGLILSDRYSLKRLTPTGQVAESFGAGGHVTPPAVVGGIFQIASVAVDSQGRLLVAGTSKYPQAPQSPPAFGLLAEPPITTGRILRYLPNGGLDTSFGDDGTVETDFGLPPPMSDGKQLQPKPLVEVTGVAVDDADRIVLSGGAAVGIRSACFHDWFWNVLTYAAFIARLEESGTPDPTFGGGDGLFGGHDAAENPLQSEIATEPIVTGTDGVAFLRGWGHCPDAAGFRGEVQLTHSGAPIGMGEPHLNRGPLYAGAAAPDGSAAFLEQPERGERSGPRIIRIDSDGALATYFGRSGRTAPKLPGDEDTYLESIAVDERNRVLVAGIKAMPRTDRGRAQQAKPRLSFLLMRLRPQGGIDLGFGRRGAVGIKFSSLTGGVDLLLDPQGRAIVSGPFARRGKGKRGLAIARYIPAH